MTRARNPGAAATPTAERSSSSRHACSPGPCVRELSRGTHSASQCCRPGAAWRWQYAYAGPFCQMEEKPKSGDGEIGWLRRREVVDRSNDIAEHRHTTQSTCHREKTPTRRPAGRKRTMHGDYCTKYTYPTCGVLCFGVRSRASRSTTRVNRLHFPSFVT